MALVDVQTVRDALVARQLDTKLATRTALNTAKTTLAANIALGGIHINRACNNLAAVVSSLQASDTVTAGTLRSVVVHSLDNLLLGG